MKKIMITMALAAVTLGANAQDFVFDSDNYGAEEQEFYDNATGDFDTMLEKNYSDHKLLWMMRFTLKNLVKRDNALIAMYRESFIKGELRDRNCLISMLNTLHKIFPDEVNKAKMKIDTEFF